MCSETSAYLRNYTYAHISVDRAVLAAVCVYTWRSQSENQTLPGRLFFLAGPLPFYTHASRLTRATETGAGHPLNIVCLVKALHIVFEIMHNCLQLDRR